MTTLRRLCISKEAVAFHEAVLQTCLRKNLEVITCRKCSVGVLWSPASTCVSLMNTFSNSLHTYTHSHMIFCQSSIIGIYFHTHLCSTLYHGAGSLRTFFFHTPFVCSVCNLCSVSEMNICKGWKAEYRLSEPIY